MPPLFQTMQECCLMRDPAQRYQTVDELLLLLDENGQTEKRLSSSRKGMLTAVMVVVVIVAAVVVWLRTEFHSNFLLRGCYVSHH